MDTQHNDRNVARGRIHKRQELSIKIFIYMKIKENFLKFRAAMCMECVHNLAKNLVDADGAGD